MIWFFYNLLFGIGFALMLPKFLWRMRRRGGYQSDFMQRLGIYRPEVKSQLRDGGRIWLHAVSVGEIFVALQFITTLREQRPDATFVLSTTTSTGYAIGRSKVKDPDVLIYFPMDFPFIIRRVLNVVRPIALVLVEAEFWPNLIRGATRRGIPVFLINGRISESSYRGYRRLTAFTRRMFPLFRALCVQSADDAERLKELGAPADRLHVLNSAKYEISGPSEDAVQRAHEVLRQAGFGDDRRILLGGSTWPGEERVLLEIYKELRQTHTNLALVLAPRHVERTPEVLTEIEQQGLSVLRRSGIQASSGDSDVFLLDTTGELSSFFPSASVIFIGKSLLADGGQNVIEPAVAERAIVVGPNMQNFPVVLQDFLEADALRQVNDADELQRVIVYLLDHEAERSELGERAGALVRSKAGGIVASVDLVVKGLAV